MSIAELSRAAGSAPYGSRASSVAPIQGGVTENALVPVAAIPLRSRLPGQDHLPSEAPFLTHLIATAEQIPQTRNLRRASSLEALTAYRSAAQNTTAASGAKVRQIA
jgi:hypothetical protein